MPYGLWILEREREREKKRDREREEKEVRKRKRRGLERDWRLRQGLAEVREVGDGQEAAKQ